MRQIFSIRFFAAVGAVIGLFFLLMAMFFGDDEGLEVGAGDVDGDADGDVVMIRRIDLVDQVVSSSNDEVEIGDAGVATGDTDLVLDERRALRVVADTPGVDLCPEFGQPGACAVVADLLGDAVVWFALVPMGERDTVDFPAIDVLVDGRARLVNGWELPYAPVLDRRCRDDRDNEVEFASYREFRDVMGDDFTSIYSLEERRIVAVECRRRVDYAPSPTTIPTTAQPTTDEARDDDAPDNDAG